MKKNFNFLIKFLCCFYCLFISQMIFGQYVDWTGAGDGINWTDPANWETNEVPSASDPVLISGVLTKVQINAAGQTAGELTLDAGAKLSIISGDLTVKNSACCAINMNGDDSLYVAYGASLTVSDVDYAFDIYRDGAIGPSVIQNAGIINIGPNIGTEAFDVYELGQLKLINEVTGEITGCKIDGNFININPDATDGSEIINHGSISISLFYEAAFNLNNETTIDNHGTISADSSWAYPIFDLFGRSMVTNHTSGRVDLLDFNDGGINLDEASTFINDGLIEMEDSAGGLTGEEGIDLDDDASQFTNNGRIQIIGLEGDAALEIDGTFDNNGNILLSSQQIDDEVIKVRDEGELNNNMCGVINIASTHAIKNQGTFNNEGMLTTIYVDEHINEGNFLNTTLISTLDGLFNLSGNALTGSGEINTGPIPAIDGFCSSDCPTNRTIFTSTFATDAILKTKNEVVTDGEVIIPMNKEVVFQAGTTVTLTSGFSANAGAIFKAKIENCLSTITFEDLPTKKVIYTTQPSAISLEIAPNPIDDYTQLQFNVPKTTPVNLRIFDAFGLEKIVLMDNTILNPGRHLQVVLTSHLSPGMYLVSLEIGSDRLLKKIIVSR